MKSFILGHMEEILAEWESFAGTLTPAADAMDSEELRDHARQMLEAIAKDIQTAQSDREQVAKSKGKGKHAMGLGTAASAHGALRHEVGFDLAQLVAEFRALRASVLKIWISKEGYADAETGYEMARFNEAIDQALAESVTTFSEALYKSRDTFLGILGHDLRSPLSAVAGALHVIAKSKDENSRERALAAGTRSVAAMSAMIRDLLEYTRTSLGKGIPIDPVPADLAALCRTAIEEISLAHPQTIFQADLGENLEGRFDAERLRQVISNLLNNAVQHGAPGLPVLLSATGTADDLVVRITNQGTPIAPGDLHSIFDPLVQIPTAGQEVRTTNIGLGLFIARAIVLAHGGTIHASSTQEEGTSLSVTLPR